MRKLELTDSDHIKLLSILIIKHASETDAARQADKSPASTPGDMLGDGWRKNAAETKRLIEILKGAQNG